MMLPTSGTYNFQSIQTELIIREAFENIGILGELVELQKLDSAKRSINLIQLEWMTRGVNLWSLESAYLPLVTNQGQYTLPSIVSDIVQANLRTSTRQLNGVPQTNTLATYDDDGGGVAANAFDGNPATFCQQNAINGNISYDYDPTVVGVTQQINFVGIQSNTNTLYSIIIESSADTATWVTALVIPPQNFLAGVNVWFDIPVPIATRAYRIRETGGATLNIQEINFNNNTLDIQVTNVSRYEYQTYPNKILQGRPNLYYLDRQIIPILNIWPVPSDTYNCLQYSYKQMLQDVGTLATNTVQIPARFYPALIWGLTWRLAVKYNPDQAGAFKAEYEQSFNLATKEDTEDTPIRIYGEYSGWLL
jgi:hypothetical protein